MQLILLHPTAADLRRFACACCGTIDTDGAGGPPSVDGAGPYGLDPVWHCSRCLAKAWRDHEARQAKREARHERLEAYRQGVLRFGLYLSHEAHARLVARLRRRRAA